MLIPLTFLQTENLLVLPLSLPSFIAWVFFIILDGSASMDQSEWISLNGSRLMMKTHHEITAPAP